MGNRHLTLGIFVGLVLALGVTGAAAWLLMAPAPAGRAASEKAFVPSAGPPGPSEPAAASGIEERLGRIEDRLAAVEEALRSGPDSASSVRRKRCFLLRNAFVSTGRFHENQPVYRPTQDGYWQRIGQDPSLHPEIESYRLLWFGGAWSPWYTPGKDDFDTKTNLDGTSRLVWACFTDHDFQVRFRKDLAERCLIRRNPFVDTGERVDGYPVYRPTGDDYWARIGPDPTLHPEIKRYRYQHPGGPWSPWYVPGRNDLDDDVDPAAPGRRLWCNFGRCRFQVEFR